MMAAMMVRTMGCSKVAQSDWTMAAMMVRTRVEMMVAMSVLTMVAMMVAQLDWMRVDYKGP